MFAFEKQWAMGVLEGFAPPEGPGLAPKEGEVEYQRVLDAILRAATPITSIGMRLGVLFAITAPFWLGGIFTPLHRLPPSKRAEILDRLLDSKIFIVRELLTLVKIAASFALLASPTVRARSEYDAVGPAEAAQQKRLRALPVVTQDVVQRKVVAAETPAAVQRTPRVLSTESTVAAAPEAV